MAKTKFFTTKTLVSLAMFTAIGYALSFLEIPIFPAAPFLKLDFTNVITLLAGYMFGVCGAFTVELVKQLLIMLTHSDTAGIGQLANLIMTMGYVLPPVLMYRRLKGKKWVAVGMTLGSVCQIAVSLVCNRFITFPLYMGAAAASAFNGLWYYIVAFNAIKAVAISVLTFLLYKRLARLLDKMFPTGKCKPVLLYGVHETVGEEGTAELAARLAKTLKGGEIILLHGELGAGKTVFVRALAEKMQVEEGVVSPTFTLMNEYHGERLRLVHIDAYRLNSGKEAYEAGLTEYFGAKDCVCCIEWAENIADAIAVATTEITIKYTGENTREIEIK